MKNLNLFRILWILFMGVFVFASCSDDDDDDVPTVIPEIKITSPPVVSGNSISYEWTDIPEAVNYTFQLSTNEKFAESVASYTATENNLTIPNLEYNTTYYGRVRANLRNNVWTEWANATAATTDEVVIDEDLYVEFTTDPEVDGNTIKYYWTDLEDDALSYVLQISTDEDFDLGNTETYADIEQNYILIEDLEYSTTYYARVYAKLTEDKITEWSETVEATTEERIIDPDQQVEFTNVPVVSKNTISYEWSVIEEAVSYIFQISTDEEFIDDEDSKEHQIAENTILVDNLKYGTTYFARVQAVFEDESATEWSKTVEAATEDRIIPDILNPNYDVDGNSVTLYFQNTYEEYVLTHINIFEFPVNEGSEVVLNLELTTENINQGNVTIENGLEYLTAYTATIYGLDGEEEITFNSIEFNTQEEPQQGLDLTQDDIFVAADEVMTLGEILAYFSVERVNPITITLASGYNKNFVAENESVAVKILAKNITVSTENGERASLNLNAPITPTSSVESIKFEYIDFTTSTGDYAMSFESADVNMVMFDNCKFTDFPKGVTGSAAYPKNLIVENTTMIWTEASPENNGHAIVHYTPSTGEFALSTKNCTFVNMPMAFVRGANASGGPSIQTDVHNCTFIGLDRVPEILFRFDFPSFSITNCIFAKLPGDADPDYFRPFVVTPSTRENNFKASDQYNGSGYTLTDNNRGGVTNLSEYSSEQIFPNMSSGNYTLSDEIMYEGQQLSKMNVGDARWFSN
ncbi:MAG: hypothetical protein LUF90_01335 [Rikenellaceae bacterium]|nr:hypothetical protein [Rikenellaceae bacterium]